MLQAIAAVFSCIAAICNIILMILLYHWYGFKERD